MEAYQAYYNTNEAQASNATQVLQTRINVQSRDPYPLTELTTPSSQQTKPAGKDGGKRSNTEARNNNAEKGDPKMVTNITHIDQKGAHINITNINNHQTFVIYANR